MDKQPQKQEPTKKVITVDAAKCIGCGLCISSCGEVFEFDENGKSRVKDAAACAKCNCQEALDHCPAKAISWKVEN